MYDKMETLSNNWGGKNNAFQQSSFPKAVSVLCCRVGLIYTQTEARDVAR